MSTSIAQHQNLSEAKVASIVQGLRKSFLKGTTRSREWRVKTLRTFQKMMIEK